MKLVLEQVSALDRDAQDAIHYIGSLYARADCLYMFPQPITPDEPFFEGGKVLCRDVRRLPGVLEYPTKNRADVQALLNIDQKNRDLPTVCLTSGMLGALESVFQEVFQSYSRTRPVEHNVVIDAVITDISGKHKQPVFQPGCPRSTMQERPHLTDQGIAYNLFINRAGGGAVGSAIASGTPWVSITEPLHPQVNAIAQCARKMGLARVIPYEAFEEAPREVIERELLHRQQLNKDAIARLYEMVSQAEYRWAEGVIQEFLF